MGCRSESGVRCVRIFVITDAVLIWVSWKIWVFRFDWHHLSNILFEIGPTQQNTKFMILSFKSKYLFILVLIKCASYRAFGFYNQIPYQSNGFRFCFHFDWVLLSKCVTQHTICHCDLMMKIFFIVYKFVKMCHILLHCMFFR